MNKYIFLAAFLMALLSCSGDPSKELTTALRFELNADSTQIVLKGLDHHIVQSMEQDSVGQEELSSIYSVYRQALADDMIGLEKPYPGRIKIISDNLVYLPDSGFAKGGTYRAEFRMPEFYDQKDVLGGKQLPGKAEVRAKEFKF